MKKSLSHPKNQILLFSRYPQPGTTKTRLIPFIGELNAAELQRELTEKALLSAKRAALKMPAMLKVCYQGGSCEKMKRWLGNDMLFERQCEGDLGRRMYSALKRSFCRGFEKAILIGSDIPGMRDRDLLDASLLLDDADLVVGPATDGGYWLIGMKKPLNLFEGIGWGGKSVFESTLSRAHEMNLRVKTLGMLSDVDNEGDLISWIGEETERPFISVIVPAINEQCHVQKALRGISGRDVEKIVVDGGSTDNTVKAASLMGADVLSEKKGRARQLNRGAEASRGKVLLFLHADTMLPANFRALIFECLLDRRNILGAFRFRTDMQGPFMRLVEMMANIRSLLFGMPYGDQAIFMRRTDFERLGGFPYVNIAEDMLLVRKASRIGRIKVVPGCAVTSARRWRVMGLFRTTLTNKIIEVGMLLGVSPSCLKSIYDRGRLRGRREDA